MDKELYKKKYQSDEEVSSYSNIFSSPSEKMISELEIFILNEVVKKLIRKESYLDVACGFGRIAKALSKNFSKTFALDSSENMLKTIKSSKIKTILSDASNLPFPNKTFDFITCFRFIMNVPKSDRLKILKEINRVMKDDGIFACNLHINRYSARGIATIIRNAVTKQKQPNMSYMQIKKEPKKSGFEISSFYGIKILPYYGKYIFFKYNALFSVEKQLSKSPLKFFADGYVIICKKVNNMSFKERVFI